MRSFVRSHLLLSLVLLASLQAGPVIAQTTNHVHYEKSAGHEAPSASGALAPRLQNLGNHKFPVTTGSESAQAFINQGLILSYGFNHAEAARAFREAARLDPDCAMAYWGNALVLGPNINAPMDPADEARAYDLVRKAVALKAKTSARESAYIDALAQRYSGEAEDRRNCDRAYAEAMRDLSLKYPDDLDAATLYAEALMDLRPWDYWMRDGKPYPGTEEIEKALDSVIRRDPDHPGALHLWIHLWEATRTPERAEAAADRLLTLVPGAGHLVHMPGHIYQRVGRYRDVIKANRLAIEADEDYITQCRAQGIYPLGYYPHNIHFLWYGASMAGLSRVALDAAHQTAEKIPLEAVNDFPFLQGFLAVPYWAEVRFGKWADILAQPAPRHDSPFMRGVWRYARATALIRTSKLDEAQRELDVLWKIAADPELDKTPASFSTNSASAILRIAPEVAAGELAARRGDYASALAHLEKAVRLETALVYTEPADWPLPVRHVLGAVLLDAGRPLEAEVVYWEDLRQNPENGWSLAGLANALRAQGKTAEAEMIEERYAKAWPDGDIKLTSSSI